MLYQLVLSIQEQGFKIFSTLVNHIYLVKRLEEIEQKNIQNQEKNKIGETKNDQSNGDED